jgi:hypothetical protein
MLSLGTDQSPSHADQEEKDARLSVERLFGGTGETASPLFGRSLLSYPLLAIPTMTWLTFLNVCTCCSPLKRFR